MGDIAGLHVGLKGWAELVVDEQHTAPKVGSGRVHVLALLARQQQMLHRRQRVVVTLARFDQRAQKKAAQIPK